MKKYNIINNVVGWVVFAIAAFTYCSTIEPTASFWDCPEFITTAYKLEVGHPPGAPFFMLFGNFFSLFASDASQVAKMINTMSALLSAGCILFLFWSVTHLAKKLLVKDDAEPTIGQLLAVMGSGIAGALIYTWSDTFWFSAVEGEVYAFSSFFTALVFWLILKWEDNADQPHSDRWLVFIAYLVGLSIGVHLLNLLCIPAIVLVYYYKMSKNPTGKGSLLVLGVSVIIVAAVLYGIVPGIVKIGGWFELLFVNTLGMPYNIGLYIYLTLLAIALVWALWETTKAKSENRMYISFIVCTALLGIPFYGHGAASVIIGIIVLGIIAGVLFFTKKATPRILNTAILCMTLMTVGYSSYAVIVIRSTANPPMDQNSPEDVFTLGEYLGREQYGERPLFFGQTYKSQPELKDNGDGYLTYATEQGAPVYQRKDKENENEKDEYIKIRDKFSLKYPSNQCMLFPRIYSDEPLHVQAYESWLGDVNYHTVEYKIPGREPQMLEIPGQIENIRFFLSYQMNWMYWRYFMWNFAGRQNDIQGNGELEHGNWLSGFGWLDNMRLGNQDMLPSDLKNNKGHNVFFCLPLILGLLGFFWQAFRDKKGIQQFWVVFFLFFMTGIAIVIYLNQTPLQPRERDYAYAGSFYAFSMWCGLGIAAIYELLDKWLGKKLEKRMAGIIAGAVGLVPAVAVPAQMVSQTWDDHDRSDRYMCRDFGLNYLETIPHDGVIYTNGDNDTFPLWYNQETEGFRTDARTCNLSYLQTDWYIDQMKRPSYLSPSLPITWDRTEYVEGTNEYVVIQPEYKKSIDELYASARKEALNGNTESLINVEREFGDNPYELKNILKYWIRGKRSDLHVIPTDSIVLKVDKEAVRRSGMLIPGDSIPDYMHISLKGQRALYKKDLMKLEMLAEANWERPIYIAVSVGSDEHMGLSDYFMLEGLAYRFTPFNQKETGVGIDSEKMFDNLMHKFKFGGIDKPGIYIDENASRMCYTHRRMFSLLIQQLMEEGKRDKAKEALDYAEKVIPHYNVVWDYQNGAVDMATAYYELGENETAEHMMNMMAEKEIQFMTYYLSLDDWRLDISAGEFEYHAAVLNRIISIMEQYESPRVEELDDTLNELFSIYKQRVGE